MNKEELIKYLNDLNIMQTNIDYAEDIPQEIWDEYFESNEEWDLYPDTHRWYELAIDVFKVDDWYLGVEHICQIFNEEIGLEDIKLTLEFFEMEQVPSVIYVRKYD